MLRIGDIAPNIEAKTTDGKTFQLSEPSARHTVLFFFPRAFTRDCTKQTALFRDNFPEVALARANLIGISGDDRDTQCRFATAMRAPFPLIADQDRKIAAAYGVLWPLIMRIRRVTFVVGPNRVIEAVFNYEFQVRRHTDGVLSYLDSVRNVRTPPALDR